MNSDKCRIVITRSNLKAIVMSKNNKEQNETKNRDHIICAKDTINIFVRTCINKLSIK